MYAQLDISVALSLTFDDEDLYAYYTCTVQKNIKEAETIEVFWLHHREGGKRIKGRGSRFSRMHKKRCKCVGCRVWSLAPSVEKRWDVRNVENPPREEEASACGVSGGPKNDLWSGFRVQGSDTCAWIFARDIGGYFGLGGGWVWNLVLGTPCETPRLPTYI
jgi:hypothetical protein